MREFAKKTLREFWNKHNDTEDQFNSWYKEVSKANWETPADLKSDYAKAGYRKFLAEKENCN